MRSALSLAFVLLVAGCLRAEPQPRAGGEAAPEPLYQIVTAYELEQTLRGQHPGYDLPMEPVLTQSFAVAQAALNITVVNQMDCADVGSARIDFQSKDSGKRQTIGPYQLVGAAGGCTIHGEERPFPLVNLGPGNHTVTYYVAGSVQFLVRVQYEIPSDEGARASP